MTDSREARHRKRNQHKMLIELLRAHSIVVAADVDEEALQRLMFTHQIIAHDVDKYMEMTYKLQVVMDDPLMFGYQTIRADVLHGEELHEYPFIRAELPQAHEFGCFDTCEPD